MGGRRGWWGIRERLRLNNGRAPVHAKTQLNGSFRGGSFAGEELGALMIEAEANFAKPFFLHGAAQRVAILGAE